jgi:mRNA interferase MazF
MPPTIGYSFGDIVLVPFPFTDQSAVKRRPAVIAGLLKASAIKPVVTTIENRLVLRRLGRLKDGDQASLRQLLTTILG